MRFRCTEWRFTAAALAVLFILGPRLPAEPDPEPLSLRSPVASFAISSEHGNLTAATFGDLPVLGASADVYWWEAEGKRRVVCEEIADQVLSVETGPQSVSLRCRIPAVGIEVRKDYWLVGEGNVLAKRITVPPLTAPGVLRVRSAAGLAEPFRRDARLYSQRQSWGGPPDRILFGVRRASEITRPVVSSSGWDNRLVAAFADGTVLGHYRLQVRGQYVPPSTVIGAWAAQPDNAYRYTPGGWDFELLHTMDGEKAPVDATAYYHLCRGDFRDLWREYRELPEFRETMTYPEPDWVPRTKVGGFWHLDPETTGQSLQDARALAARLGDGALPLGIFAWSLDGDYETEVPFLNEPGNLILTPEWFAARIADFQADPRIKMGTYFQGALIDSASVAFREHPEWALLTAEGKPFFSGFRDNPLSEMYFFNPLSSFADHFLQRVEAVSRRYEPGWIYLDGGGMFESTDYRLRRPLLADEWMRLHRRLRETIKRTSEDRALLMNAQNMPFGDLYWLECSYFDPRAAWRDTVEFCYDTEVHHEPRRTMLPLYWQDEPRYLAMCVAFGFTPCLSGIPQGGDFNATQWRAIDAADWMRDGRPVLTSAAVSPDWLVEPTDIVAVPERVGPHVVIPVLSMGQEQQVTLRVVLAKVGLPEAAPVHVRLYRPLLSGEVTNLGLLQPEGGTLSIALEMSTGWQGLTLVALGSEELPVGRLPVSPGQ